MEYLTTKKISKMKKIDKSQLKKRHMVIGFTSVLFLCVAISSFGGKPTGPKRYFCGRQGDITVWVDNAENCLGDLSVVEGSMVTMKYDPKVNRGKKDR